MQGLQKLHDKSSIPALLTISLCLLVQAVQQGLQVGSPRTYQLNIGNFGTNVVLNLGLLISLPLIGAAGALLAKRMGEPFSLAVRAVLSPVALISAMLLCLLAFDLGTTRALVSSLEYSSGIIVGWVIIPAAALIVGGVAGWKIPLAREKVRV
jgi:hypothetical protein